VPALAPTDPDSGPIKRLLDSEVRGPTAGPDDLRRAVGVLKHHPGGLRTILDQVAPTAATLHPNGFVKVVVDSTEAWILRLHIWPVPRNDTQLPGKPHGHRWDFASWILAGALREVTYASARDGEEFELHSYDGHAALGAGTSSMLNRLTRRDLGKGEIYVRTRDVLHATAPPAESGLTASLVVRGPQRPASAPVYLGPGAPPEQAEEPVPAPELRRVLDELRAAVL
jgi:hypothetical protein